MPTEPTDERDAAAWSPLDSDGWYAARNATTALRDAGLEKDVPYSRAERNALGHGLVELGRVSPGTAERLGELLRLALAHGFGARGHDYDGRASPIAAEQKGRA